jgi:hypothetical protein
MVGSEKFFLPLYGQAMINFLNGQTTELFLLCP